MALSVTAPRPSLMLASLGLLSPIVETDPERMLAIADALTGWAEIAAKAGKEGQAFRYLSRARVFTDLATTHRCCGVSLRDYCQC